MKIFFHPPFLREAVVTIASLCSMTTAVSISIPRLSTLSAAVLLKLFPQNADI